MTRAGRCGPAAADGGRHTGCRCAGGRTGSRHPARTRRGPPARSRAVAVAVAPPCRRASPAPAPLTAAWPAAAAAAGGGGRPHCRASGSKDPPSASVAEVSTTVWRRNRRSASSAPTSSGAIRSVGGRRDRRRRAVHPHHVGPGRDVRAERGQHPAGRRAHLLEGGQGGPPRRQAFGILGVVPAAGAHLRGTGAGRVADRGERGGQRRGQVVDPARPGRPPAPARPPPPPPAAGRPPRPSAPGRTRRAAVSTAGADSSAAAAEVTRFTRSCASSMITTSCSGRTPNSSSASIASSAWLVTTMSARPASSRARSAKQRRTERAALGAEAFPGAHRDLRARPGPPPRARGRRGPRWRCPPPTRRAAAPAGPPRRRRPGRTASRRAHRAAPVRSRCRHR